MNRLDFIKTMGLGVATLATIDTFGKSVSSPEDSFYEFYKESFAKLNPNVVFSDAPYIKYVCGITQKAVDRVINGEAKEKDLIFALPPRMGATGIFSVALPAYIWSKKPNTNILNHISTFGEGTTYAVANSQRSVLMDMEGGPLSYYNTNKSGGTMLNAHILQKAEYFQVHTGSNVTGYGADFLISDCPQTYNSIDSRSYRENTNFYYDHALSNRVKHNGLRILVTNRLHKEDLAGHLRKTKPNQYEYICLPAMGRGPLYQLLGNERELQYKTLDKNRLNNKFIMDAYNMIGPDVMNLIYQQRV